MKARLFGLGLLVGLLACSGNQVNSNNASMQGSDDSAQRAVDLSGDRSAADRSHEEGVKIAPADEGPGTALSPGEPLKPAEPGGKAGVEGMGGMKVAPNIDVAHLLPAALPETDQVKGCRLKYEACQAAIPGDVYRVEYQRVCTKKYDDCVNAKPAPVQCMDKYNACNASISPDVERQEGQRVCSKNYEICMKTEVYPDCCKYQYDGCIERIPAGENKVEYQRGCNNLFTECTNRYSCD